jgi:hypothetical protein
VIRPGCAGVSLGTMLKRLPILLTCPLFLAFATPAQADFAFANDICLPAANPHPDWWSPGLGAQQRESRWAGASVRKESVGSRAARLRSVWSPGSDTMYVEIVVGGDPTLDDEDAFVFSISDAAQTLPELYVEFHPLEDCPDVTDCDAGGVALDPESIAYAEATPTASSMTWSALSSTNPSSDFEIEHPWIVTTAVGSTYTWTLSFAMTVPTDGSGDFVDRLMYGNAIAYWPGYTSGTYYELPLWCESSSLSSNNCLMYSGESPELPEDLPFWPMLDTWPLVEAGACGA